MTGSLSPVIDTRHHRAKTGATESLVTVVGVRKKHFYRVPVYHSNQRTPRYWKLQLVGMSIVEEQARVVRLIERRVVSLDAVQCPVVFYYRAEFTALVERTLLPIYSFRKQFTAHTAPLQFKGVCYDLKPTLPAVLRRFLPGRYRETGPKFLVDDEPGKFRPTIGRRVRVEQQRGFPIV